MPPTDEPEEKERSAADFLPAKKTLKNLDKASQSCRGCNLYKDATQTVFGEGNAKARIIFVGEQPGDVEDKTGHVFVGPAGKLFDRALAAAGIDKEDTYRTNAVKHFKYEWRGERRIHSKPRRIEVAACFPWLQNEIEQIKPDLIVCLGATAAQAIFGPKFKVTQARGQFFPHTVAKKVMATVHPSSILRARDDESRHREMDLFVADLKKAKDWLDSGDDA